MLNSIKAQKIIEQLEDSMRHSTWYDAYPEAFDELFNIYTPDMIGDVEEQLDAFVHAEELL